jgi:Fic family protein
MPSLNDRKAKRYYYIQHSYRRDGKVITKERYLGMKIKKPPRNPAKSTTRTRNHTTQKLQKSKNLPKECEVPPSAKERVLQELAIIFTYNTNAIEGSTIT